MPNVMFWNVQDLGVSNSIKNNAVGQTIYNAATNYDLEYVFLCEIKSDTTLSFVDDSTITHLNQQSVNPITLDVEKQGGTKKKSVFQTNAQLGYFGFASDGRPLHHDKVEISDFEEVFSVKKQAFGIKGRNAFKAESKRAVIRYSDNGNSFFFYHANSSAKAKQLVPWVSFCLDKNVNDFFLFGDFNQDPGDLESFVLLDDHDNVEESFEIGTNTRVSYTSPGQPTHNKGKILDYVISKGFRILDIGLADQVTYASGSQTKLPSDHTPVIVQFD